MKTELTTDSPLFKRMFKIINGFEFEAKYYHPNHELILQSLAVAEEMLKFGEECYYKGCGINPLESSRGNAFSEYLKSINYIS